jgi:hypothetical protein
MRNSMQAAVNISNSPAALDFFGDELGKLWCTSATETLHLWDWADAAAEPEVNFEDLSCRPSVTPADISNICDARRQLTMTLEAQAFFGEVTSLHACLFATPAFMGLHFFCERSATRVLHFCCY